MRKLKLDELNRLSNEEFKATAKIPVALVLDDIRSALNVGSIFRSADAFAIEKIFLCGISATPPHREINKTAIGATESVSWQYFKDRKALYANLLADGYRIIAIEQTNESVPLSEFVFDKAEKIALILGNEVDGVHIDWIDRINTAIELEQFGTKHSLNVSVCAGIVLFYFSLKYRK